MVADPVNRARERALRGSKRSRGAARWMRAGTRTGLLLRRPPAATGLLQSAHTVYGEPPNVFHAGHDVVRPSVFHALLGLTRAEIATRIDPPADGRVLGLTGPRRSRRSAADRADRRRGSDRRLDRRDAHVRPGPSSRRCCTSPGMCAPILAPADRENPRAAVEVPRPDHPGNLGRRRRRGCTLLVVIAQPGASLAARDEPDHPRAARHDRRRSSPAWSGSPRTGWFPARSPTWTRRVRHPELAHKAPSPTSTGTGSPSTPTPTSSAAPAPGDSPTPTSSRTSPTGHARAKRSECARSARTTPLEPGRCTS